MTITLTHILPAVSGGVSDYVGVSVQHQTDDIKLPLNKESATRTPLSGHIFLHFSGYGYAKRGAPLWLLKKLQAERVNIKTLGVYFHELYAFGPPWSSALWLSPVQRHIARRIAELSDFWITNREGSARWLRRYAGDMPHAVLPVFSNVGEMPAYTPERAAKIVVFGSASLRMTTYRTAGAALFSWAREQGLEIHDIGPAINDSVISASLQDAGVVQHGRLDLAEVSKQLSDTMFGILAYPVDYVAKSGVFAAYCAHGMCPVLISKRYAPADGLVAGTHYFAGIPVGAKPNNVTRNIGAAAWNWYQLHNVKAHVDTIKHLLREVGAE